MVDDILILQRLPESEHELQSWAEELAATTGATIRESEMAADQYCWRLSINNQHWLLIYSAICESGWLQALEGPNPNVNQLLQRQGYLL